MECNRFYKELVKKLADKRGNAYSIVAGFVRANLSFSLLKSSLLCLRGTRGKLFDPTTLKNINFTLANIESHV